MSEKNLGLVKQIIGAVVDVEFQGELPEIYTALEVESGDKKIVLEIQQHIGSNLVRTIA
ncbi:MAG: F0F1 ATP synthase subunit beta, partial [Patescibacteria group bacterium]